MMRTGDAGWRTTRTVIAVLLAILVAALSIAGAVAWIVGDSNGQETPGSTPTPRVTPPKTPEAPSPSSSSPDNGQPCTMSRILVPSCGAWWGSSRAPGGVADLLALERVLNRPIPIAHFFHRDGRTFPDTDEQALARRQDAPTVLFGNVKPGWVAPGQILTWEAVADGEADAYLDEIADSIVALDRPVFLTLHHEPEDDVVLQAGSGYTPTDYTAMFRHVVDRIDGAITRDGSPATGYPIWVWDVTGYPKWESLWPQLYPGERYVDWVGYNPYLQEPDGCDFGCVVNRTYAGYPDWTGFYDWAVEEFPGKPLLLGEWGVRESTLPGAELAKAEVFASVADQLALSFPQLRAVIYFNDGKPLSDPTTSRIETSDQALRAFQQMVDDPYFRQQRVRGG